METLSGAATVAVGSVVGRAHRRAERDGQDGCAAVRTARVAAAIVTDGCSSGSVSEVGARLGAAWLKARIGARFACLRSPGEAEARAAARAVTADLIGAIGTLGRTLSVDGSVAAADLGEMFLFGFLAAVVTDEIAIVFGVGDGMAWVDGATSVRVRLDPGPANAPVYPAYALMGAAVEPHVVFVGPAREVDVLGVATDGAETLTDDEIAEILRDPRYARNASLLRKRLVVHSDRGRFHDDASVGVVQRRLP